MTYGDMDLGQGWLVLLLAPYSAPNHYLNNAVLLIFLSINFLINLYQNRIIFIQVNWSENDVYNRIAIWFGGGPFTDTDKLLIPA